jgi:hypothetical protein
VEKAAGLPDRGAPTFVVTRLEVVQGAAHRNSCAEASKNVSGALHLGLQQITFYKCCAVLPQMKYALSL